MCMCVCVDISMVLAVLAVGYSVSVVYPQYDALLVAYTGYSSMDMTIMVWNQIKSFVQGYLPVADSAAAAVKNGAAAASA